MRPVLGDINNDGDAFLPFAGAQLIKSKRTIVCESPKHRPSSTRKASVVMPHSVLTTSNFHRPASFEDVEEVSAVDQDSAAAVLSRSRDNGAAPVGGMGLGGIFSRPRTD